MSGWQIFFGVCGDYLGRKKVYLFTLIIIIVATIGQAMSASTVFGVLSLQASYTAIHSLRPRIIKASCFTDTRLSWAQWCI